MRILIACHSRTGHTEKLAQAVAAEFRAGGNAVTMESIRAEAERNRWKLVPPLLSTAPVLPLYLASARFRRWWLRRYRQASQAIAPPAFPDLSDFDLVCIGGPKWLYLSYPLARYLDSVTGLKDKPVGTFATFCGPPLPAFEIEMLFSPLEARIVRLGGRPAARLAVSSHFHEFFLFREMEYVFRALSRLCFRKPLRAFTLESDWGAGEVKRFCAELTGSVERAQCVDE